MRTRSVPIIAVALVLAPGLTACTDKLESRMNAIERDMARMERGLLSNDQQMKSELRMLKQDSASEFNRIDRQIRAIRTKTDLFCVEVTETGINFWREGHC